MFFLLNCFVFESSFPNELELKYVQISFRKREKEGFSNLFWPGAPRPRLIDSPLKFRFGPST